ncbi:MAG: ribonucleoside-diphosphate reductase, adenosylcobalamin-dependent [Betaproteobacteria bacterium]|nr:ribonucleoside-diphosphate reductase, adenosylcobalamin-dependent [Betaproteobacteria bacterium]
MKLHETEIDLPPQQVSLDVLLEKYAKGDERSVEDVRRRVARALAAVERDPARWEPVFYDTLANGFIPGGRVNSAAGTELQATLINCFVQPVGDSVSETADGKPGIYVALMESAETMRRGGGVGYDFSAIRPHGAQVRGTQSTASGPVSYMRVFDKSCETVESAGSRRGAQMGILRCDHPDIEDFIHAKDQGDLTNFNISVAVTDVFMRSLAQDADWPLMHKAKPGPELDAAPRQHEDGRWIYRTLKARDLWRQIMQATYDHAEPGVFFIDHANADNNLSYCETIEATNPCVTADTRLHTQHGMVPIGELQASRTALRVTVDERALGRPLKSTTVCDAVPAFQTASLADVYRVETEAGYEVKATQWHDFFTDRGKVQLRDLRVGDRLLVQSAKGQFGEQGSEELGVLLGLMTGDGHFTNRGNEQQAAVVGFWGEDRTLAAGVAAWINTCIAGLANGNYREYRVAPIAVPSRKMVEIRSILLARFLSHYGFCAVTKHRVPEVVWRGTEQCVRAYLRGLFQSDGTVNVSERSQSCSVRLASSYRELLNDVQILLANFGIFAPIWRRRGERTTALPDGHGGREIYRCRADYELIVDGESRDRFMREIGFLGETKTSRYEAWAQGKVLRETQSFTSRIKSITYIGREAVFDTTQPNGNTVIFNGLVTGQCGEQPLPAYGCCCLGSIDLTRFVDDPFGAQPRFDFDAFARVVRPSVRMLDNVLDVSVWPLPQQKAEAMAKRRIGLGFTGLGGCLVMLGLRYDSAEARTMATRIAAAMRDQAYASSVEIAREKGAFPLLDKEQYLAAPRFASRLPEPIKAAIRTHGIRNCHLLSIAPTGTISLAFADNASNGIEPPYAWSYQRKKRMPDNGFRTYDVEDQAWRLYRHLGGDVNALPPAFVTALELSAQDHMHMVAAVAPYVDSAISKTVNVAEDYPYERFEDLYLEAWRAGLKGLTTYRPNRVLGSVLSLAPSPQAAEPNDLDVTDADRRIRLDAAPEPALSSLRWPGRPKLAAGNPSWTYMVESPFGQFAIFVGHVENGERYPFEVWVNGNEQPRGLGAVAKTLSMDMRAQDKAWLRMKLDMLARTMGDDTFDCPMPPDGETMRVPSMVAAFARIVRFRVDQLGAFEHEDGPAPVLDTLFANKEPKTGTDGTMSWTVDVLNAVSGDDFLLILKELVLPAGQRRPYSVWLAGSYPRALDGLCKLLSLDMRVIDPAWIGMKLRKLLNYAEPLGDFMARVPGMERQQNFPSTVAYIARLIIHRYAMLGVLDERGYPVDEMGVLEMPDDERGRTTYARVTGKPCKECGNTAVIKKDGCEFCTACGAIGACG